MDKVNISFSQAPAKTIAFLKDKKIATTFSYKDLEKEAHLKAFTAAKIMQVDVLADIQDSLVKAMKEGQSFKKWKKEIKPTLVKKGWYGEKEVLNPSTGEIKNTYIGSRRLKTIFETNMRVAHAQGRANSIYASTNEYLQYHSILDSQTREDHKVYNGIVKHRDDTFWINNFPPNGWGCRCYITSLSKKDLERKGLKVDTKEYKDFADKDFAYDLRNLSKENLKSTYYKKAINLSKNCIELNAKNIPCKGAKKVVQNAIEYIYSQDRLKEYQTFVDETIKDVKYPKNMVSAGAINFEVYEFLKSKDIIPATPHIYLSKQSLTHMTREAKASRDAALSTEEIKEIPNYLKQPYMIIYDTIHKNVLYLFNGVEKENKIVVEVNYKYKKQDLNMIVTSGKVELKTIEGEIKKGNYKVIKR